MIKGGITGRRRSAYIQINIVDRYSSKVVSSKIMGTMVHGWITFPVTDITRKWIASPKTNQGITVTVQTIFGDAGNKVVFASKTQIRREPILVVFSKGKNTGLETILDLPDINKKNKERHRERRNVIMDARKNNNKAKSKNLKEMPDEKCQLRPLKVPVSVISSKVQILGPNVLEINQCVGSCIPNVHKDLTEGATSHAIIQAFYAATGNDVKYPCCSPATFEPIITLQRVIIGDQTSMKIALLQKAIATSCSCL